MQFVPQVFLVDESLSTEKQEIFVSGYFPVAFAERFRCYRWWLPGTRAECDDLPQLPEQCCQIMFI